MKDSAVYTWRFLQMSEVQSGELSVRDAIAIIAGEKTWADTRESWLARAQRRLKHISYRTLKACWYNEISSPAHWAVREIRREAKLIEARKQTAALAQQYQRVIRGLTHGQQDPDLYRDEISQLERIV